MKWLKHAFAVEPAGAATPTPEQSAVIERVCREVIRRQLATPTLMFLEMSRPLSFFASQALHFLAPFVTAVSDSDGHRQLASFLEKRGAVDYICDRIQALEQATTSESESAAEATESSKITRHSQGVSGPDD